MRFARTLLIFSVAFLPLFSGIAGGLHLLLVRHVVCRAHGEFVHADAACAYFDPSEVASASTSKPVSPTLTPGDERRADRDEHCTIAVLSRPIFLAWSVRGSNASVLREWFAPPSELRSAPAASIELVLLAPKQSPPA